MMTRSKPDVVVRRSKSRWPIRRPQRWYVAIVSGDNGKDIFVTELYANRQHAEAIADWAREWFA